ncbi:MAG TPA: MFS transporter [Verrucomicrobiae bacterium]|jgi:OPA family sugar phosphate sensor protein UhpC-like MFS transporter
MATKKNPKYERWRWIIFGVTWLAYAGFYLTRKAFSIAKNELKKPTVLGLTTKQMSNMDGAYSAAYAIGQFFWGTLGDRYGTRKVVLFGMMASIVTAALMGVTNVAFWMGTLFALQGLWQASGWAPLGKNMGEFFSQRERGSIMGFWCTNYALGGFVASIIAGFAAQKYGWRYAFFIPAVLLGVIWILFLVFQRNRPEDLGLPSIEEYHDEREAVIDVKEKPAEEREGTWHVVRTVMRNGMVWYLGAVYFLVKPTRYLLLFWSPVFIAERMGTNTLQSGLLSSMFDLAGPIGTLAGGIASDKIFNSKRMPVAALALFLLSALMLVFPFINLSRFGMGLGMFAMGFLVFIPDSLISGTAAIDFGTKKGASTANGVINGLGSVGQMLGVLLPGWVESILGKNIWTAIFVGLGISLAIAGLMLAAMWNRVPPKAAS